MIVRFSISLLLIFTATFTSGQVIRKYIAHGDAMMYTGDYAGALRYYNRAMDIDSSNVDLLYNYAEALRLTNHYGDALNYYKKVYKEDRKRKHVMSLHHAAEMYKYLGKYDASVNLHRKFLKKFKGNRDGYEYIKSKYEDEHYPELAHLIKHESEVTISNEHPINTANSEFGGFFVENNELLFSSLRSDSSHKRVVLDTLNYYSRIYQSHFSEQWNEGIKQASFEEEEQLHLANAVYSDKSEYVYYTECNKGVCKIYRARNSNGRWFDYKPLPDKINLPGSSNSQPILARVDGFDYLFFSSDREGGYGKLDIWYTVVYSNGLFEDPGNLGPGINSPGNEICPYYMEAEQALYFSSDFLYGLGGFDLFKSKNDGERFSDAENIGRPFNSSYNDLYFRYGFNKGTITSNRTGSLTDKYDNCCNDLYFFEYQPKSIKMEIEMSNMEKINRLLPLRLFFNNDEPNPKSSDTSTTLLYSATYINYNSKKDHYELEYAKGLRGEEKEDAEGEIRNFFQNEVMLGYNDLKKVLVLLNEELDQGQQLEIVIKGYASPLSKSDYNKHLTLRRIVSVENELKHFNKGSLSPYLSSGQLVLKRMPFGEDLSSKLVSDDLNDKRNAVYSKKAAFERRVELISIKRMD